MLHSFSHGFFYGAGRHGWPFFILAERAKENQGLSEGRGIKGLQNSANLIERIDTRQELARRAGVSHPPKTVLQNSANLIERIDTKKRTSPAAPEVRIGCFWLAMCFYCTLKRVKH